MWLPRGTVLIEGERLICLNSVVKETTLDPGFSPGEACGLAETHIPNALFQREAIFVAENDKSRTTLVVPMRSARGHDLGWVGLSLSADSELPRPEAIRARIETMAATL